MMLQKKIIAYGKLKILLILFCISFSCYGNTSVRIDPPFWWTGMKEPRLQLMIYGKNISDFDITITYPGIVIKNISKAENPNYVFIDITINTDAKPGIMQIVFKNNKENFTENYELKQRRKNASEKPGLNSADLIYVLMPDRFANGDTSNDSFSSLRETQVNRKEMFSRHGGDLKGITGRLDYLQNLGVTAIWSTPLVENNMDSLSYHGYAATDLYKIDPRFGTNDMYEKYVSACHQKNIKVIMDVVLNHVGKQYYFIKDLPMQGWTHAYPEFTKTNYRSTALMDPYASNYDKDIMSNGWFDKQMPDLNQQNNFVATYLIQNNIWWIEYANVDAFRLDTYSYSDLNFLKKWTRAILNEYPNFGIFGETWVQGIAVQAYFAGNNNMNTNYNSQLPAVTDFQMYYAINDALTTSFGWTSGLSAIYLTLAQDFVYSDADKNILFLDNHDLDRFYSKVGEDINKYKMGIAFIMTMRGIPSIYYGTEIVMKNYAAPDGKVREDFPGGWPGDKINKFDENNLSGNEKEAYEYVKKLANWRKTSAPVTQGKLMQFVPYEGVYVYFRYTDSESVMVVMNSNEKEIILDTKNYAERITGFTKAKNIVSGEVINDIGNIKIPAMSCTIFEMQK